MKKYIKTFFELKKYHVFYYKDEVWKPDMRTESSHILFDDEDIELSDRDASQEAPQMDSED